MCAQISDFCSQHLHTDWNANFKYILRHSRIRWIYPNNESANISSLMWSLARGEKVICFADLPTKSSHIHLPAQLLNASVCSTIFNYKGTKMKLDSMCRAYRAQFNGPIMMSQANFHIELEPFCCSLTAAYACIWASRLSNKLRLAEIIYIIFGGDLRTSILFLNRSHLDPKTLSGTEFPSCSASCL